ncbi:hypothetical protein ACH44C_15540 [Streptomyces purpureus]|uniref:hypothetical protein n=1 Tax=Streptomyces purpureus TaxID=1951 RepID=UPI0037B626DE
MKLRHVRAIAVFGVALVALTGARGSGGGGCDNHSSSSSSSGGSSSSGSDGSSSSGSSSGSDSSSSGGVSVPGGSSANKAERDVRIDDCLITRDKLTVKLTVTNNSSTTYKYDVGVQFKGEIGGPSANVAIANVDDLLVPANSSKSTEASTPYTGTGDGSEYKKCQVMTASRTMS